MSGGAVSGGGSPIRSIQSGICTIPGAGTTNTATISAVVVAKSVVIWEGNTNNAAASPAPSTTAVAVALTNATTVSVFVNAAANVIPVYFTVVEFV